MGVPGENMVGDDFIRFSVCHTCVKWDSSTRFCNFYHGEKDAYAHCSYYENDPEKPYREIETSSIISLLQKNMLAGIHLLTKHCLEKFSIITLNDTKEILVYDEGIYRREGQEKLLKYIQQDLKLGNLLNNRGIAEFLGFIQRYSFIPRDQLQEPINKICLSNGILNLDQGTLESYSPEQIFLNKIPVHYNPRATCPRIQEFLDQVLPQECHKTFFQLAGFLLYKKYFLHVIVILFGSGANGKSTIINLLKTFIGAENCCSRSLQELEENRFAAADLHGKLANLYSDLSDKALCKTSKLKMLTGEDLVTAEKKFKNGFSFVNYAKLIFSCNRIPKTPDHSDAFYRRILMFSFPNQFLGTAADKFLLEKLTSCEELSGLLNKAVEGLLELLRTGEFDNRQTIQEARELYTRWSDSVGAFAIDCLISDPEAYELKETVYLSYVDYCQRIKCPRLTANVFHRNLQKEIKVVDYRPAMKIAGKQARPSCWKGIKLTVNPVKDVKENPLFNLYSNNKIKERKNLDNPDIPDTKVVEEIVK